MQTNCIGHILAPLLTSCIPWLLFSNCIYFDFIKNVRDGIPLRPEVQRFIAWGYNKESCLSVHISLGLGACIVDKAK